MNQTVINPVKQHIDASKRVGLSAAPRYQKPTLKHRLKAILRVRPGLAARRFVSSAAAKESQAAENRL